MLTYIEWHETKKELPKPKEIEIGKSIILVDEPCLVIYKGKVKPSSYISKEKRWSGHTEEQTPEYWVKLIEIDISKKLVVVDVDNRTKE